MPPPPPFFLSKWINGLLCHSNETVENTDSSSHSSSNHQHTAAADEFNSLECYACTQFGVPAFHSTSCDQAHQPEWEASAGSSLVPIQSRARLKTTSAAARRQGPFGSLLDPRSKRVQRWNRFFLIARGMALAVDPLFFYSLSIGRGGAPCLYMDGGLAAVVTILRTCVDAVHLCHLWLQFRMAYVSRETLVVGCGKLVWDARAIASHYVRSLRGFWFDVFVILPVPQGDSAEDFEALFDYRRVQPTNVVFVDDDGSDAPPIPSKKRKKTSKTAVEKVDDDDEVKIIGVSSSKDLDEEDWLPPPPVVTEEFGESSTIKELRLKKQELESLVATSADSVLQAVEESVRRDFSSSEKASVDDDEVKLSKPSIVREKIIITVQDKDGEKQYRVFKDEMFERFFKKYADKVKLCMENLVFIFDGDKINPTTTPDSLGMEDDDIIEVRVKKS